VRPSPSAAAAARSVSPMPSRCHNLRLPPRRHPPPLRSWRRWRRGAPRYPPQHRHRHSPRLAAAALGYSSIHCEPSGSNELAPALESPR
jgi:hypothetical protein